LRPLHDNTDRHDRPLRVLLLSLKKNKSAYQFAVPYCGTNTRLPTIHAVGQLAEEMRYKPEGLGFEYDGVTGIFHQHNPSGRTMASNRNEYEEYVLGVRAVSA